MSSSLSGADDVLPVGGGPRAVPVQGSTGEFKLKLKLGAPRPPATQPPPCPVDDEDEEEDQLASSSSSEDESRSASVSVSGVSSALAADGRLQGRAPGQPSSLRVSLGVRKPREEQEDEDMNDASSRMSSVVPSDDGLPHPQPRNLEGTAVGPRQPLSSDPEPSLMGSGKKGKKSASAGKGAGGGGSKSKAAPSSLEGLPDPRPANTFITATPSTKKKAKKSAGRGTSALTIPNWNDPHPSCGFPAPLLPAPTRRKRPPPSPSLGPPPPPPVTELVPLPVGPPPKAPSGFLPAQPLERKTASVRRWKRVLREVVGVSGFGVKMWTYAADPRSNYAIAKQAAYVASQAQPGYPLPPPGAQPAPPFFYPPPAPPGSSVPPAAYAPGYDPGLPLPQHITSVSPSSYQHRHGYTPPTPLGYVPGASGSGLQPLPPSFRGAGTIARVEESALLGRSVGQHRYERGGLEGSGSAAGHG